MEMIFFSKLNKLMNQYFIIKNNKYKDEIIMLFLNLDYKPSSLHLINYSLEYDYDLFNEFIEFLAFTNLINFKTLKPLSDNELYLLDGLIFIDNELAYDQYELFLLYQQNIENLL